MKLSRSDMRAKYGLSFKEPSLTKQAHKAECDINVILDRYIKAGVKPELSAVVDSFFDASSVPDFQTAMNTVSESNELFFALPARVRSHFENDTSKFLDYFSNPNDELTNRMLIDYKLLSKRDSIEAVVPQKVSGKGNPPEKSSVDSSES